MHVPAARAVPPGLPAAPARHPEVVFGPYRLVPQARKLFHGSKPVRIGSRALDLLILLAERPGSTVASDELMAGVWPGIHVERNTLRVQISALRKLLGGEAAGEEFIVNVTGRGYALVAPLDAGHPAVPPPDRPSGQTPSFPARLIGRDKLIADVRRQLRTRRLVTLVGPGGAGKTAVATRVAAIAAKTGQDVMSVDLSPLLNGDLLSATVASRLGLQGNSLDATPTILRYLSGRHTLLVLDTCEHVIADAARFATAVLAEAPHVRILATSREGLRVAGEHVSLVRGLALPDVDLTDPAEVLAFPAVRLFIERARAAAADLRIGEEDATALADVCRRLDGLPLAIELAAALAPHLGLSGLARALADRFAFLTNGYRTALTRHQTLRATVEWSYRLLDDRERTVFRRFGIFRDAVAWDDAVNVVAFGGLDGAMVTEALQRLLAKSLVDAVPGGQRARCRMLDTNRDFAWAELEAHGELEVLATRHAEHWAAQLEDNPPDPLGTSGSRKECEAILANVRLALRWCWSAPSLHSLGVRLTLAAVPLWTTLSLTAESIDHVSRALSVVAPEDPACLPLTIRLHAALGSALMNIDGAGERVRAAWSTVLRIAEELGDTEARLKGLWGLWIDQRNHGNAREALDIAQAYGQLSSHTDNPLFRILGDRMLGISLFFVGEFAQARARIERMLARSRTTTRHAQIAAFQFDQTIAARCFEAQILWLQGCPDQASAVSASNVEDAIAINHAGSLSYALSEAACPIALRNGDLDELERCVTLLLARTTGPGLEIWNTLGRCYESFLQVGRGDRAAGLRQLGDVLGELRYIRHGPVFTHALAEYALLLADAGRTADAERAIHEAFARLEANGEWWCSAELKRIRAELCVRAGAIADARGWFAGALAESRRQGALAWELRATTGVATLLKDDGRTSEAEEMMRTVLQRYREGEDTRDVRVARALLTSLH